MLAYSGMGRFLIEPIDVRSVVEEMLQMLAVSISKKIELRLRLAEGLPAIDADGTQIRQIVMNLITNASEAIGEENGVILIRAGAMDCDDSYLETSYIDEDLPAGLYVYLEVTDTGCGMDEETQSKLFEPFFSTKFTGRGLGMAAVLGIVRGHKGAIQVESEVGRGTTFRVLFPASKETAKTVESEIDRGDVKWRGAGTVLLVDDEETIRSLGAQMLKRLGFDVVTAVDGREAVEVYRAHRNRVVCVLLDLTMPRMDGGETFRELRRVRNDLPVILSSGYSEYEVSKRFEGTGVAGFIQKPYEMECLRSKLREVLEG
jgi:CheY-like chemotaxis protein